MADKSIDQLDLLSSLSNSDLFLVQSSGTAFKTNFSAFVAGLQGVIDGHGSILSIAKTSTSGLVDTYTITYSDGQPTTFTVKNGAKGDTGTSYYVWIRYSAVEPTRNDDMTTTPSAWVGVYSGTSSTAPTSYTSYSWYKIKGETGGTGNPAELDSSSVAYAESASDSTIPASSAWSPNIPASIQQGHFLWTRTILTFNSGDPVTYYTVSRQGVDGAGVATEDTPLSGDPSGVGIVGESIAYARSDHRHPSQVYRITGSVDSNNLTIENGRVTENSYLIEVRFGTPANVKGNISWATSNRELSFSGTTFSAPTTFEAYLAEV